MTVDEEKCKIFHGALRAWVLQWGLWGANLAESEHLRNLHGEEGSSHVFLAKHGQTMSKMSMGEVETKFSKMTWGEGSALGP